MLERRDFILACCAAVACTRGRAASRSLDGDDPDQRGAFERVLGQPGVVVGVPHGTADSGTLESGRIVREPGDGRPMAALRSLVSDGKRGSYEKKRASRNVRAHPTTRPSASV